MFTISYSDRSILSGSFAASSKSNSIAIDMHFMNARENNDPLMKQLVEASDADHPLTATPEDTAADTGNTTE